MLKNKKKVSLVLCSVLLCVSVPYIFTKATNRRKTVKMVDEVVKNVEFNNLVSDLEWDISKVTVDCKDIIRISTVISNTLPIDLDSLNNTLTLYNENKDIITEKLYISGTILTGETRYLSFDIEDEYQDFKSFKITIAHDGYKVEKEFGISNPYK